MANKWIDEIHLTQDGGIIKRIYKKGESGACPAKNQEVTVNYIGRLEDGTIFDQSISRGEPLKFIIGTG